jgi:Protein of unknown function (DUF732)
MGPYPDTGLNDRLEHRTRRSHGCRSRPTRRRLIRRLRRHKSSAMRVGTSLTALIAAAAMGGAMQGLAARAHAAPAPEVEYVYDVMVRRHYNFSNPDEAINYGHGICDKVSRGEGYAQVMGEVKSDIVPNDEFAANYLVSYAVNLLCPAQIWQLRNSAAHYQPPAAENAYTGSIPTQRRY